MESNLSEDALNKTPRSRLMTCIRNKNTDELIKVLNSIKPDNRSQVLLDTGTSGITPLSYAIRHNMPEDIIEKIVEIAENGNFLKKLLKIKNHHGSTALDFAKKYDSSKKIVELLLNKEQKIGVVSHFKYNRQTITMTDSTGISMGDQIEIIREKTQQEQVSNDKKLTQVCSGSTPTPSITVDGSTVTITHGSDIQIDGKGITISGKKIL